MKFIKILREKFDALREADPTLFLFGSETHQYISYRLTEKQIEDYEKREGFSLPEEYKEFLMYIGYGMGPFHQLYPLKDLSVYKKEEEEDPELENNREEWKGELIVDSFEDITQAHVDQIVERYKAGHNDVYPFLCIRKYKGVLLIGDRGGTEYIALIVKGPMRGTIWELDSESATAIPTGVIRYQGKVKLFYSMVTNEDAENPVITNQVYTFYEWIDEWVESYLAASRIIPGKEK